MKRPFLKRYLITIVLTWVIFSSLPAQRVCMQDVDERPHCGFMYYL